MRESVTELICELCCGRPVIRPQHVLPPAHVDHRLNGEYVPGLFEADEWRERECEYKWKERENRDHLHDSDSFILGIVRDVGRRVKQTPHAVAAVSAHNCE